MKWTKTQEARPTNIGEYLVFSKVYGLDVAYHDDEYELGTFIKHTDNGELVEVIADYWAKVDLPEEEIAEKTKTYLLLWKSESKSGHVLIEFEQSNKGKDVSPGEALGVLLKKAQEEVVAEEIIVRDFKLVN